MSNYYILDEERNPIAVGVWEWSAFFENPLNRCVAEDYVGESRISTVFLGLNSQCFFDKPPLIFETMVFGGELDEHQVRYSTWNEAVIGHQAIVSQVNDIK